MIKPARRRLTAIFASVIIAFSALILALSFMVLRYSLMSSVKRHMMGDIKDEFLASYRNAGASLFKDIQDEDYFQLQNKAGKVVAATSNAVTFCAVPWRQSITKQADEKIFSVTVTHPAK